MIVIPDEGLHDYSSSYKLNFDGNGEQIKYFVFQHQYFIVIVYLVNKVYCMSLLFLQPLYGYQRLYCCSHSKRQIMIIQINNLLSLCIPDDPVDDDREYGLQQQSNYFGLIPNF